MKLAARAVPLILSLASAVISISAMLYAGIAILSGHILTGIVFAILASLNAVVCVFILTDTKCWT